MEKHIELNRLMEIKTLMQGGQISYAEAQKQAAEPLKQMNEKAQKISESFGMKHRPITFNKIMR